MEELAASPAVVNNGNRKKMALVVLLVFAVISIAAVFLYLRYKNTHISTDDAFIEGRIHVIASKVPGTVSKVQVETNQMVKAGDLLVEVDDADYDAKFNEASSSLDADRARLIEGSSRIEVAKRQLSESVHRVEAAKASLVLQEAVLKQAELDLKRARSLVEKDVLSKERLEKAVTARDVAAAQVKAAREQLGQAESSLVTQEAVIRQAEAFIQSQSAVVRQKEAAAKAAGLQKGYTRLLAPVDGYVTKKTVEAGNQIQPGQPLMAVVPLDDIWVMANYKETQLAKVRPGQKVSVKVDTYPGASFNARVESIMSGTGAAFSLFPSENATGNFVKVVQRVPVKIVFEKDRGSKEVLRVGMSVEPTIVVE